MIETKHQSLPTDDDKWQRMSALINQHPTLTQPDLAAQFKKLIVSRFLMGNLLVLLLQYIGLMFSTFSSQPSPIWFASGTATAFIFLRGRSILPGIWLGSFLAYYLLKIPITIAFSCATIYTLQAFFLQVVSYRYIHPTLIFYDKFIFLKFILCSAAFTFIASFLLLFVCYSFHPPMQLIVEWWLANLNGLLIFACALLTLDAYFPDIHVLKRINLFPLIIAFSLLFVMVITLLLCSHPLMTIGLLILISLITFMISKQSGWCGVVAALFMSGFLYGIGASFEMPFFSTTFSPASLIYLQWFLCMQTILGLYMTIKSVTVIADE